MEYFEILNSAETQALRKEIMDQERAERAQVCFIPPNPLEIIWTPDQNRCEEHNYR